MFRFRVNPLLSRHCYRHNSGVLWIPFQAIRSFLDRRRQCVQFNYERSAFEIENIWKNGSE